MKSKLRRSLAVKFWQLCGYRLVLTPGLITLVALLTLFPSMLRAQLIVDCSGANPSAYPTINAALLGITGPGATVLISGVCTEDVVLTNQINLNLGAWWGTRATLRGHLSVNTSESIYLYGLDVTNVAGDGINIYSSRGVTLQACTSSGNAGVGLSVFQNSDVNVVGPSAFDNNGSYGANLSWDALLTFGTWNGQLVEINNNKNSGIWMSQASFLTFGNTAIVGNASPVAGTQAWGITEFGASRIQIGTCTGPNTFEQNQGGGISAQENSEVTLWTCAAGYRTRVENNGPVGISVGYGGQLTLYDDVDITGHAGPGVDIFSNGQLHWFGSNVVAQNGVAGDPRSAGIRLDGNSQALLRGGQISSNTGPGILALVNSSTDFSGVSFSSNTGGIITCDTSAYMVSDLPMHFGAFGPGVACLTPHNLGPRPFETKLQSKTPDFTALKNRETRYKQVATPKSH